MTQAPLTVGAAGAEYFRGLRQGSVIGRADMNAAAFSLFGDVCGEAAVVSQTCDVVLPKRPTVLLAPVVELRGDDLQFARRRDNPRYVPLPVHGAASFADLGQIHAVDKLGIVNSEVAAGIDLDDDVEVRTLALAIGRWFSRFAFPDDLVPWLRPLLKIIREKYNKTQSPLGQILQDVVEIRVEAEQWSVRPLDIGLHIVVKAGVVPTVDDMELGQVPITAYGQSGKVVSPAVLAELITGAPSPEVKAALWPLLAESLALACHPSDRDFQLPDVSSAVSRITGEFWTDDEFPLSRQRKSELLDVDYLSDGYPL